MGQVLGFVGWPCAGKDEAAEYLVRAHGAYRFGHSDFIRELAAELGIKIHQTSQLSALFETWAAAEGYGWIARIVSEQVLEIWSRKPRALVVVSGVRNLAEVQVYRDLPGFQLVRIEADFEVRYLRWLTRQRPGEQGLTREHLQAIEALPGNANLPDLMALPGPVIINNGNSKPIFFRELGQLVQHGGSL